jgi:hypothetical protein
MSKYKLIQLTNNSIPATTAGSFLPLGLVTRRFNAPVGNTSTFEVTTSAADTVYITEPGYYKVTYSMTATAGAAGLVGVSLIANQNSIYTVAEEATAAEDIVNITLVYVLRICPNCCSNPGNCPVAIQLQLGDTALGITPDPSIANLVIEKVG